MVPFVFFGSLLVIGLVITLALGGVLLAITIIKAIFGAIFGGTRAVLGVGRNAARAVDLQRCNQVRCHAMNPPRARFCRRCGKALAETLVLRAA